ncbi:MAG: pyridoxamine 5'-phosphate oxidase family protein [Desulfobacteraceae bacterium]|nr:pyridoxamine 5'-phosphate oxidase family protein [Desulfobacteraceae bacterium]
MAPEHNSKDLKGLAEEIINGQSTMTLATAEGDVAWAAAVYYVYVNARFYFFSDPESRHIRESLASGQASAAIHGAASTWQEIRGLQMSGNVGAISVGPEAVKAVRAYLKKFTFTTEFFESGQSLDLAAFTRRFRVRLYKLEPFLIYYLDNSIRFGFREEVVL